MVWVRCFNGTVRHPVNTGFEGSASKRIRCRKKSVEDGTAKTDLMWVHVCSDQEMKDYPPCKRCMFLVTEEEMKAAEEARANDPIALNKLMSEC